MAVFYAGVTLPVPTAEVVSWIEQNLSLQDVLEFSRLCWPSFSLIDVAFPGSQEQRNKIRLGRLFWPRGASRWSMYHGIVDDATLTAIRTAMGSAYTAQPFVMTWIDARTNLEVTRITTDLFLLPPCPLSQIAGFNGPWLLTLVDERFFWWQRSTGALSITEGTTTWEDLYTTLGAQLGVLITPDAIPAAYLKPSFFLGVPYAYTPILLDAVAFNVGHRIVRGLDGTVRARNPANAVLDVTANRALATAAFKQAGGVFNFDPLSVPNDDPGLLPFEVTLTFPQVNADSGSNVATGGLLAVSATLASLLLPDIPPTTPTSGGAKVFHDTAPAQYLASVLQNNAELVALTRQMATDWYRFQLAPLDVKLAGIVPWNPDALHDWVEWSYAAFGGPQARGDACTRICRGLFNDLTDELAHGGGVGGQSQPPGTGLPPPYPPGGSAPPSPMPPVYPPYPGPPGGGTFPLPPGVYKLRFDTSGGSVTMTGFSGAANGQLLFIWNIGPGTLTLQHNAGVPASAGILTPLTFDYVMQPRDGVILQYDGVSQRWRFDTPTIGAGTTPEYAVRQLLPGAGITITPNGDGTATVASNPATQTVGDLHFWHDSLQYYSWFLATPTVLASPFGNIVTIPFLATSTFAADEIALAVQNNDAVTHNIRLAIYTNTGTNNLYPNTLLFDSGDLAVTPTGLFIDTSAVINLNLLGLYWLALQVDDITLVCRSIALGLGGADYYLLGRTGPSAGGTLSWTVAQAYGAFTNPFPAAATRTTAGPYIHLHHAV